MDFSPLTVTEALASKSYEKIAHICDHVLLQPNYSSSFVVVVVVVVRATWYSVNVVWTGCGRGRCLWGRLALLLYSSSRPHLRWWYVCLFVWGGGGGPNNTMFHVANTCWCFPCFCKRGLCVYHFLVLPFGSLLLNYGFS